MASRFGPEDSTFLLYLKIMRNKYLLSPLKTDVSFPSLQDIFKKMLDQGIVLKEEVSMICQLSSGKYKKLSPASTLYKPRSLEMQNSISKS